MPCSSVWENKISKFNQLFTNGFFGSKERVNFREKFIQCLRAYSPNKSRIAFTFYRNKCNASSKPFHKENKAWKLSVAQRKDKFIQKVLSIFGLMSKNTKTTFSIDKSCYIRIINFLKRFSFFDGFEKDDIFLRSNPMKFFKVFHYFNEIIFSCFTGFSNKTNVAKTLFFSLFKKRKEHLSNIRRFFSAKTKSIKDFLFRISNSIVRGCYRTTKIFLYIFKNIDVRGSNNKLTRILIVCGAWLFSNIKAAVAVNIPSYISKNIFFNTHNIKEYNSLSHKVTEKNTPTELTKADIDAAVKTLLGNDAEMISDVVVGRDAFGTAPVRPAFWAYIDTDLLDDLEAVSNFNNSANYPNQQSVLEEEWGATGNVRWLYTSIGSVSSASPAVYNNFIIGKEAYAVVHLGSETGEFYIEPLGSAGAADPLHQRGSVGWEHPFVSRILNDAFMLNLMATHS